MATSPDAGALTVSAPWAHRYMRAAGQGGDEAPCGASRVTGHDGADVEGAQGRVGDDAP